VFGQKAVSGIRFFFWDSQFGRFFNTGPIKGKGDPFFFMHTLLWAFLPWSILLIAAIISIIVKYRRRMMEKPEWLTVSGAVLTFIVFSLSRFQLPHYITIIFPLLAIITADYIDSAEGYNQRKFITVTQAVIIFILPLLAIVLFLLARPGHAVLSLVYLSVIIGIIAFVYRRNDYKWKQVSFVHTASVALIINLFFNTVFYPWLMRYQSGSEAAHYINNSYPGTPVIQLKKPYSYPMEFYLDDSLQTVDNVSDLNRMPTKSSLIYLPADSADNVKNYTIIRLFDNFPVSRLNGKFLNPQSRDKETETYALMINNSVVKN
jgi:4-amino-4-deoxy-L-arabinose transferase-like glycosyltransferase